MLITKKLLAKHHYETEHSFVSSTSLTYNNYEQSLEANVKIILTKYPALDTKKVKDLLVELDNSR